MLVLRVWAHHLWTQGYNLLPYSPESWGQRKIHVGALCFPSHTGTHSDTVSLSLSLSVPQLCFSILSLSFRPSISLLLLVVGGQCSLLLYWPSSLIRSLDVTMETTRHYITSSRSFSECVCLWVCARDCECVYVCVCVGATLCQNADAGFQFYWHWTAYTEGCPLP